MLLIIWYLGAPRKIAVTGDRGQHWSERKCIGTRTKRNHSQAILWCAASRGYFSRCPWVYWQRATYWLTSLGLWSSVNGARTRA